MATESAIEVIDLRKTFGHRAALRRLNLRIAPGEFLTIFGPNGAGKTTLVRILAGLVRPSSGSVRILNTDLSDGRASTRRHIGVISHQTYLYPNLTARENLQFYGRLFDVDNLDQRINTLLEQVELTARGNSPARTYSRGMAQRLTIARALLHDPRIILLDEPYTGLDEHAAGILTRLLHTLNAEDRSFLMTTHNIEQGLDLSQRIAIQLAGKIVFQAPREGLVAHALRNQYLELIAQNTRRGDRGR